MQIENFCCIGAELQKKMTQSTKMAQIYFYRSFEDETIDDMMKDGFFNPIYDRVNVNDYILLYHPEQQKSLWARVKSNMGGQVTLEYVEDKKVWEEFAAVWAEIEKFETEIRKEIDDLKDTEASEDEAGLIKISNEEDALSGLDDSTAMTPLKVAKVVYENVGRGIQLGFHGTLENNVLTFETTDEEPYTLKHNYDYEIDLLFEAVGELPDDIQVVIKNGEDTINIVNVLHDDFTKPITVGELKQIMKYSTNIGWRWIFMARFTITPTGERIFVMPSTVVSIDEVETISNETIYNKLHDSLIANPDMIRYENDTSMVKILAGSTFVFPNGNKFDRVTIEKDIQTMVFPDHEQIIFTNGTQLFYIDETNTFAGDTAPTAYQMMLWYDSAEKKIKYTGNGGETWQEGYAFPFGYANNKGIVKCFCNGIGYFANCSWILDGVEVLIPNDKNKDGTFNNIKYTVERPLITVFDDTREGEWALSPSGIIVAAQGFELSAQNHVINKQTGAVVNGCPMGKFKTVTGRIETMEVRGILDLSVGGSNNTYYGNGGGFEIGDIGVAVFPINEALNQRRYLNGQLILQAEFVEFTSRLKEAIKLYPSLACIESEWQEIANNSVIGQCGKFVIDDSAGTIRLPKVVNISGLHDLSQLGNIKDESLPNVSGMLTLDVASGYRVIRKDWYSGAMVENEDAISSGYLSASTSGGTSTTRSNRIGVDASRSSPAYKNGGVVAQEAAQYPYFIQVATKTETEVDVVREIELNNPFDLLEYKWSEYEIHNFSWLISNGEFHSGATYPAAYQLLLKIKNGTETKEGVSVKLSTEEYDDYDFVLDTENTTFRLPLKVAQIPLGRSVPVVGNGTALQLTNGTVSKSMTTNLINNTNDLLTCRGAAGISVGDSSTNSNTGWTNHSGIGIVQSGNSGLIADLEKATNEKLSLYFYVGETIQNANLINASNMLSVIGEKIAEFDERITSVMDTLLLFPDYQTEVQVNLSETTFTMPYNGLIVAQFINKSNTTSELRINGKQVAWGYSSPAYFTQVNQFIFAREGDTVYYRNSERPNNNVFLKYYAFYDEGFLSKYR